MFLKTIKAVDTNDNEKWRIITKIITKYPAAKIRSSMTLFSYENCHKKVTAAADSLIYDTTQNNCKYIWGNDPDDFMLKK